MISKKEKEILKIKRRRDPGNESAFAEISFVDIGFGVSFISGFLYHDLFWLVDTGIDVISWMVFL